MMTDFRIALVPALVAALSTSCVNTPPEPPAPPTESTEVSAEESSFRLFPLPDKAHTSSEKAPRASSQTLDDAGTSRMASRTRSEPGARRPRLRTQIEQTPVTRFSVSDEESLSEVIAVLRNKTGLPLVVHPSAENAVLDAGIVFDFDLENELRARQVLDLITAMADDQIGWLIRHDAILFTEKADARGPVVVHAHDIRELVSPRTDYVAPRIGQLTLLGDEDADTVFGGSEQVTTITEDEVLTLVTENIEPTTWDLEGVGIEADNGQLIVVHSIEVQLKVARFLRSLG